MLTPPAPLSDMLPSVATAELDWPVVLPRANSLLAVPAAPAVAEIIRMLLLLKPTLTIPAPLTVTDLASKVVFELEPVVLPVAKPCIV